MLLKLLAAACGGWGRGGQRGGAAAVTLGPPPPPPLPITTRLHRSSPPRPAGESNPATRAIGSVGHRPRALHMSSRGEASARPPPPPRPGRQTPRAARALGGARALLLVLVDQLVRDARARLHELNLAGQPSQQKPARTLGTRAAVANDALDLPLARGLEVVREVSTPRLSSRKGGSLDALRLTDARQTLGQPNGVRLGKAVDLDLDLPRRAAASLR